MYFVALSFFSKRLGNVSAPSLADAIKVAQEALRVAKNEGDVQQGLMPLFLSLKCEFQSDFFVQDTSTQDALKTQWQSQMSPSHTKTW